VRALAIVIAVLVLAVVITLVMLDEDAGDAKRAAASSCTEQNAGVAAHRRPARTLALVSRSGPL
jgi:preprotein translocase subunit SecG